ncbi:hypothetical protein NL676_008372 [Syzygium grande]|nr:hypothetical protein NL676_008372 [Syzygium grande]
MKACSHLGAHSLAPYSHPHLHLHHPLTFARSPLRCHSNPLIWKLPPIWEHTCLLPSPYHPLEAPSLARLHREAPFPHPHHPLEAPFPARLHREAPPPTPTTLLKPFSPLASTKKPLPPTPTTLLKPFSPACPHQEAPSSSFQVAFLLV